jgi:hypothetical protein
MKLIWLKIEEEQKWNEAYNTKSTDIVNAIKLLNLDNNNWTKEY